jgi:hypothetical protein
MARGYGFNSSDDEGVMATSNKRRVDEKEGDIPDTSNHGVMA